MSGTGHSPQETYWRQLVLCKILACYIRRYRETQARWINRLGIFKAIVTSSTIGAWVIWKDYAIVWGVLLGAVQVLDALKEFVPQTKNLRSASEFVQAMEGLVIDARFEWFGVSNGEYSEPEIMMRWHKLARLMSEIETKHFPDGLPGDEKREKLAEEEANGYFNGLYGERKQLEDRQSEAGRKKIVQ